MPKRTHYQRIENRAGEGMPDVYICMDGVPLWVELKIIKNNRVSVSKSQMAWHSAHNRCGGVSFFLLHDPCQGDLYLFGGASTLDLGASCISDLRPASLYVGKMAGAVRELRACGLAAWTGSFAACALRPASCVS